MKETMPSLTAQKLKTTSSPPWKVDVASYGSDVLLEFKQHSYDSVFCVFEIFESEQNTIQYNTLFSCQELHEIPHAIIGKVDYF